MENKIQELADKIYHDGVEKGNIEADKIVRQAQEEASSIIENAHKVADSIVNAARKEADKLSENAKSDLHLYAEQAVNALKSEVATLLTDKIVRSDVKKLFSDENFLHSLILAMAKNWLENEPVVISTQDAEKLNVYFLSEAKDLLDKGLKIEQVNGLKTSFSIAPADGSYKINFGEEEFVDYLKSFLRPRLLEVLF